jgi:hypothetical protein
MILACRAALNDMNAAFMSFQPRESGIHAVWSGCWRGQWDGSPFPAGAAADGEARADHDQLELTRNTLQMVLSWLMPYFASAGRLRPGDARPP